MNKETKPGGNVPLDVAVHAPDQAEGLRLLLETGRALGQNLWPELPVVLVPNGYSLESVEEYGVQPLRVRAKPAFTDASSFCAYVKRHLTPETHLWARISDRGGSFGATFDYHSKQRPGWCEHVARFELEPTPEWKAWTEANGRKMGQADFAAWLEANAEMLVQPAGAALLELVTTLEGKQSVGFTSGIRLQSGANRLMYSEEVELRGVAGTRDGAMELPAVIEAGIAPFHGCPPYKAAARLRYRIESRKLSFWLDLIAPHRVVRSAVGDVLDQVRNGTGVEVLQGCP